MKKLLFIVISVLVITSSIRTVSVFAFSSDNTYIDTKIITDMYYFSAKKTVVNDNGIAVAISDSGAMAACVQLSSAKWDLIINEDNIEFYDIITVDNVFVAVATKAADSFIFTSEDGINWTKKLVRGYNILKLHYLNNRYFIIAVDYSRQYAVFTTKDFTKIEKIEAENKIKVNIYPKTDELNLYVSDMVYFKDRYYICGMYNTGDPRYFSSGNGIIISSGDLKEWTVCIETGSLLQSFVQGENTLIAYGGNSYSARLSDQNSISSMADRIDDTNMVYTNNGLDFDLCKIGFETQAGAFDTITYASGKFFGIGYKKLGLSSDGKNWIAQSDDVNWRYGGFFKGDYVAVGTDIHNKNKRVYASDNASGWDIEECSTNFPEKTRTTSISTLIEHNGYYILNTDYVATTSDIRNWTTNLANELNRYKKVLNDGKNLIVLTDDTIFSSSDGKTFSKNYKLNSEWTECHFNDMFYLNGKYYVYGLVWGNGWENYVWISDDLSNWNKYKLNISNYVENEDSNLNSIKLSIIGNKAFITHSNYVENKTIIAVSDDMYNFTPIFAEYSNINFGSMQYYDNQYIVFANEWLDETKLASNPFYSVSKISKTKDYLFTSSDLIKFTKTELPSNDIKALSKFKDSYVLAASEYERDGKFTIYVTKDFIKYDSFKIPTEYTNLNITGDTENIYGIFSIDDVLYITGARMMYSANLKDWTILDSVPSNGYVSSTTKNNTGLAVGNGVIVRVVQNNLTVTLNGVQLDFDQPPISENGRTLVPMRKIFEALGANVEWDNETKTVTATKGDVIVKMQIGSNIMTRNGVEILLDVPPKTLSDRTFAPARAIAEGFNANVEWDNETKTVVITK